MTRFAHILAATAALLFVACSGDDDGQRTDSADNHTEDALAESLLLTIADMPKGWVANPSDDDDEKSPLDKCDVGEAVTTGRADSPDFELNSDQVSQTVAVFASAADASNALDAYKEKLNCFARLFNDGELDDEDAEYGDAKVGEVSFESIGERTLAFRLSAMVKSKDKARPGEFAFFYDVVLISRGRLASSVLAVGLLTPFNPSLLSDIATKADEKLAGAAQ
jgi:hypothetical protein